MGYSQADIDRVVDDIVDQYTGQRASYFGSFPGDSRVPVLYYVDRLRRTSPAPAMGDRSDGWGTDFPITLKPNFTHELYKHGKSYPKGTILIWNSPHVAILINHASNNTVSVFDQDSSSDSSTCSVRNRGIDNEASICMYALVPIVINVKAPPVAIVKKEERPEKPKRVVRNSPMGAAKLPLIARKYYVCKSILGFPAYSKAAQREGATGTVSQGNYFIFRETSGMLNLTRIQGYAGYWVNPKDNMI